MLQHWGICTAAMLGGRGSMGMRWHFVLVVILCSGFVARADTIGLVGSYNTEDITKLLKQKGFTVSDNPSSYTGLTAVILLRTSGSTALKDYVAAGGRLITEYTASIWAANLLAATDAGGEGFGASRPVTFTADGIDNLGKDIGSSYSDGGRTEWFQRLTLHASSTAKVLATQDFNGGPKVAAIIGGAHGDGNVVIISYDWADSLSPSVGAPTQQLLLNAIRYEAVPLPAAVWGGLSLLGVVAGRTLWRRRGGRLNGERAV